MLLLMILMPAVILLGLMDNGNKAPGPEPIEILKSSLL
jgi:hypothetical protein